MKKRFFLNMATALIFFSAILVLPVLLIFDLVGVFLFSLIELGLIGASFFVDSFSGLLASHRVEDSHFEESRDRETDELPKAG